MANFFVLVFLALLFIVKVDSAEDTLKIEVLTKVDNCERKAKKDDIVSMHYSGKLVDGKEFDSSYSRKQPFEFKLGAGQVIAGWEQGVPEMCVGEKRRLTVPPALAYGDRGFGDIIPAKSTLIFDIELINIDDDGSNDAAGTGGENPEHEHPDSFEAIDMNGDKQITSEEMTNYIKKFNEEGTEEKFENIDTIVSEIFQEDDKNKDGVISYEEYQHFEEPEDSDSDLPMVEDEDDDEDMTMDELPKEEL